MPKVVTTDTRAQANKIVPIIFSGTSSEARLRRESPLANKESSKEPVVVMGNFGSETPP
jgi:hypothetical protein